MRGIFLLRGVFRRYRLVDVHFCMNKSVRCFGCGREKSVLDVVAFVIISRR